MDQRPDDVCPRPDRVPECSTRPLVPPIYPASVWSCDDTEQAMELLEGTRPGYVYQRDGHPNADVFAEKCAALHGAECIAVTSSGMAALAAALLSQLETGDHVVVSRRLYGRTLELMTTETARLGIESSMVDTCDLDATRQAFRSSTKLVVVETIANPTLQIADIGELSKMSRQHHAALLVDNSFATPYLCRPLELGADLVMESVSKMMNGHSDVMLGMLGGSQNRWARVPTVVAAWGLASSPLDCWLASRGLATMHLRMSRACENALAAARFLVDQPRVHSVQYPGLPDHPDHLLASRTLTGGYGSVVTFRLEGDLGDANQFIRAATRIPFCPSLGEASTTLSHPASTSHRRLTTDARAALGIFDGTIRLSVGCESHEFVVDALAEALGSV